MAHTKYTDEQKKQIVKLRKDGLILKEIAKKVGINNLTTVKNICDEAGLPKRNFSTKSNYNVGERFYNFVIMKKISDKISKRGNSFSYWQCLCDCGKCFNITTKQIHRGQMSCNCLSKSNRFKRLDTKSVIGNYRYGHYTNGAKRRKLDWELSKEKFIELLFSNCYYCGTNPISLVKIKNHTTLVNGVDRVNSDIGYTELNCVSCCKFCNRGKSDATLEEFIDWIRKIKEHKNEIGNNK